MDPVSTAPFVMQARGVCFGLALSALFTIASCSGADGEGAAAGGSVAAGGGVATAGGAAGAFGEAPRGGASSSGGSSGGGSSGGSSASGSGGAGLAGASGLGGSSAGAGGSGNGNGGALASSGGAAAGGATSSAGSASRGGSTSAAGGRGGGGATSAGGAATGGSATGTSTGGTSAGGAPGNLPAVSVYLAGDSTVSTYADTVATNDQAGWGQMLPEIFNEKVKVVNKAAGGRTAYWFYLEGALTTILNQMKAGDYLFIQFGTNDQNMDATFEVDGKTYPRYADAATFKAQLKQYYLDPVKAKNGVPVLVTPPPRNSAYCNGGNGLGTYAAAMLELGKAEDVAVLDNNAKTFNYLKAICPKPTSAAEETFFKNNGGSIDGTHFQENGARKMAGFIGEEIRRVNLGLTPYLR